MKPYLIVVLIFSSFVSTYSLSKSNANVSEKQRIDRVSTIGEGSAESNDAWFEFSYESMTSSLNIVLKSHDKQVAQSIAQKVHSEFERIEQRMSRYRPDSELSLVNQKASLSPVKVSRELFGVLEEALDISSLSLGAFDISFASVGYHYDFRLQTRPDQYQIDALIDKIDYRLIELNSALSTVYLRKHGMRLDLGGIAKGYAVDQAIALLSELGVTEAQVQAGGDMYLLGNKGSRPWTVAVQDPRDETAQALVLYLSNEAISTSGDYQRFFMSDSGDRVHHILSPQTGRPVEGIRSASVIGSNAMLTDGLSTAIFVLGKDQGLKLINSLSSVEAVIIDDQDRIFLSNGLKQANMK